MRSELTLPTGEQYLRPIIMTSLAFALALGAGAQRPPLELFYLFDRLAEHKCSAIVPIVASDLDSLLQRHPFTNLKQG